MIGYIALGFWFGTGLFIGFTLGMLAGYVKWSEKE